MALFLSIDQSTSVTKGLVWDSEGRLLARADVPHRQLTNDLGWVGHDPMEILRNTLRAAALAVEKAEVRPEEIRAVGISNQRETAVCWDASTGEPVCEAVVWQCGRASEQCARLEAQGLADSVKAKTGLPLSPYFSAAKFAWMLENEPKAQQALARGTLRCGTVDAWLLWNLTGTFATEYSNASRTQLLNLDTLDWDAELAAAFGLTAECLPQIRMSDSFFGETTMGGLFPKPVPVHGVLGDSHAALYGNKCMRPGEAKVTYGTGSSLMMNAGPQRPKAREGVVTSLAWGVQHEVDYVLEGNVNYIGAVIQWLTQDVELLERASDAGRIAASVPSTNGVYLVPAFSGLGAPLLQRQGAGGVCGHEPFHKAGASCARRRGMHRLPDCGRGRRSAGGRGPRSARSLRGRRSHEGCVPHAAAGGSARFADPDQRHGGAFRRGSGVLRRAGRRPRGGRRVVFPCGLP